MSFDSRVEYNGVIQITKLIDPRNITIESCQYDNGDRLTGVTDALNKTTNHQYDSAGRLTQLTDRKGQVITYAYYKLDRITSVNYRNQTTTYEWDNNPVGRSKAATFGHLKSPHLMSV